MVDYPELTRKAVSEVGTRKCLARLLGKDVNTIMNWIAGHNSPQDEMDVIKMIKLLVSSKNEAFRLHGKKVWDGLWNGRFRPLKELEEQLGLLAEAPSSLKEWLYFEEVPCDPFLELKNALAELSLPDRYELIMRMPEISGGRQGQRNDLKVERNLVLEKNISSFSSEVHRDSDEVSDFSGRTDERIAHFLGLKSKHAVYCLKKVMESQNPVLIGAMGKPLLLSPYQVFVLLTFPLTLQKELLEKSKKERNAYLRQLKMAEKPGGKKMSP